VATLSKGHSHTNALAQLVAAVPPPAEVVRIDWSEVEDRLGFPLPADYHALMETYGEGSFDDFLWLLHPTSSNPNLNLIEELHAQREALALDPDGVGPRPQELVHWASTYNGDSVYWKFDSERRLGSSVIVNESRGDAWPEYDLSATEWLLAVLTGRIRVPVFPDDFPSRRPSFRAS